jgi:hypothetical protein
VGFAAVAGCAIALGSLRFIIKLGIDVPVWEHWDFLPILGESYAGGPWLRSVFHPFFGHMVAVPMLLFIGFSRLNGWSLMFEVYWGWFLVSATCLVLTRWVRALRLPLLLKVLLFLCVALLVFGFRSSELSLNGLNSSVLLSYFLIMLSFELLRDPKASWPRFAAAAFSGLLATWSWGAGVLVWPVGVLLLLHHERGRWGRFAVWSVIALIALSPFALFRVNAVAAALPHDLSRMPRWFLNVVSTPFSLEAIVLPAALMLPVAIAAVGVLGRRALRERGLQPEALPWVALLAHGVLTVLLILYMRSPRPDFSPAESRYAYIALFFVASLLPLGLLALREVTEKASLWLRRAAWGAAAAVLLLVAGRSAFMSYEVDALVTSWHPLRGALNASMQRAPQYATEGQFLHVVQTRSDLVGEGLAIMKRWHLGPYRSAAAAAAPLPIEEWVAKDVQAGDVELGISSVGTPGAGELEVSGWAVDRQGSRPAEFVVASVQGTILEHALMEMAAYPPPPGTDPARNSYGWRLLIPAVKLRVLVDAGKLELVALSRDGRKRSLPLPLPEGLHMAASSP